MEVVRGVFVPVFVAPDTEQDNSSYDKGKYRKTYSQSHCQFIYNKEHSLWHSGCVDLQSLAYQLTM